MTKGCIKEVLKLQEDSDVFSDLSVEQLLYAAVAGTDLAEVFGCLQMTDWSKFCGGEKYKGHKNNHKIQKIIVVNGKNEKEIDFQEIPYDKRIEMVLRYF